VLLQLYYESCCLWIVSILDLDLGDLLYSSRASVHLSTHRHYTLTHPLHLFEHMFEATYTEIKFKTAYTFSSFFRSSVWKFGE